LQGQIVSVNVGKPKELIYKGKSIQTGIEKQPVDKPLLLTKVNFVGDGQADLVNHGGEDKAVCVYPFEHYAYFSSEIGLSLSYGAFGENLTLLGLTEEKVCIGDEFQIGEAVVQVSQPRQPCFKLAHRHDTKDLPLRFQGTGYTGFYFRVLSEGVVSKEDSVQFLRRHQDEITISYINEVQYKDKSNKEKVKKILSVPFLSESYQKTFMKRLQLLEKQN
jgi:MOSC domain-containing protein YiiM